MLVMTSGMKAAWLNAVVARMKPNCLMIALHPNGWQLQMSLHIQAMLAPSHWNHGTWKKSIGYFGCRALKMSAGNSRGTALAWQFLHRHMPQQHDLVWPEMHRKLSIGGTCLLASTVPRGAHYLQTTSGLPDEQTPPDTQHLLDSSQ